MNIKLRPQDRKKLNDPNDVYEIMQRILLRENKIDREKEHFWIIGLNEAAYVLYIELVSLGSVRATVVEPMNVYRIAVMKNATRVVAVHNHPAGSLTPSAEDLDITDRLIQVGRVLDIALEDHLIITPTTYMSFRCFGLMNELENSLKYVPSYQLVARIRKEEQAIAKGKIKLEREQKEIALQEKEQILASAIDFLRAKEITVDQMAKILEVTPKEVNRIINKAKNNS